jgi:repressor of nif and glnA expression|tara:strand:+ start:695 stop:916 length:222 start_codon:yes stop_codon:yes gene_type:complete
MIKNKLYKLKEKGKREINSNILQFIIKLKEAISKLKNFLLKNNFELKILIGTVIIKKNKIKLSNICKTSIMFT